MSAKQSQLSDLYSYLSAALDAQDFPEVYSEGTDVDGFLQHARNFTTEVRKDSGKFGDCLLQIDQLQSELKTMQAWATQSRSAFTVTPRWASSSACGARPSTRVALPGAAAQLMPSGKDRRALWPAWQCAGLT